MKYVLSVLPFIKMNKNVSLELPERYKIFAKQKEEEKRRLSEEMLSQLPCFVRVNIRKSVSSLRGAEMHLL